MITNKQIALMAAALNKVSAAIRGMRIPDKDEIIDDANKYLAFLNGDIRR